MRSFNPTIVIHGGAGAIARKHMTPDLEAQYRAALTHVIVESMRVLEAGGTSLDAVERAVVLMEDDPLFNAGYGSTFTRAATHELEASIMNGADRTCGAVLRVTHVKNPVSLARMVMERSPHVILGGEGAEAFARDHGAELVANDYFSTERRRAQLEADRKASRIGGATVTSLSEDIEASSQGTFGTVGAVALDAQGNLAAATSTGGMSNKMVGRVGDTPIPGAGVYADNETCAVSTTGHGEYFLRNVIAYDVAARIAYGRQDLEHAADATIHERLTGRGGLIAIDRAGHIAMPFNSEGMYRGYLVRGGKPSVSIYREA